MKTASEVCAEIEQRLVDGPRAADDPDTAAHLRTCLRCFRTASELRDAPRVADLLRELDQPDPGDLFWARFPASVADAWERRQAAAAPAPATATGTATAQAPALFRSALARRLRGPLPAALMGAAVAAAVILASIDRPPPPVAPVNRVAAEVAQGPALVLTVPPVTEVAVEDDPPGVLGEDDPLDALELAAAAGAMGAVVARLDVEPGAPVDDGLEPGPSPVEEVEQLEGDDLDAVAQALRARSQI